MPKNEDRLLNLIADLVARFILGFGAAVLFLLANLRLFFRHRFLEWQEIVLLAGVVGLVCALFGLRKGPGVIYSILNKTVDFLMSF